MGDFYRRFKFSDPKNRSVKKPQKQLSENYGLVNGLKTMYEIYYISSGCIAEQ